MIEVTKFGEGNFDEDSTSCHGCPCPCTVPSNCGCWHSSTDYSNKVAGKIAYLNRDNPGMSS